MDARKKDGPGRGEVREINEGCIASDCCAKSLDPLYKLATELRFTCCCKTGHNLGKADTAFIRYGYAFGELDVQMERRAKDCDPRSSTDAKSSH